MKMSQFFKEFVPSYKFLVDMKDLLRFDLVLEDNTFHTIEKYSQ